MSRPELQAPPEIVGLHSLPHNLCLTMPESITAIPKPKNIPKSLWPSVISRIYANSTHTTPSTRNQQIQADMTYRALELLNLPSDQPAYLLDIGCGSGLSGEILDEEGYIWTGVDIAPSMLGAYASLVECCTLTNFPVLCRGCPRT